MNTKETIQTYFIMLEEKQDWQSLLAEDMTFTSFASPIKRVTGRAAYVESTRRFYSMITAMKVKDLIVDGDRASALTHYDLQPPQGPAFGCDVAEVFGVRGGKIAAFDIYFDSAPFPK